MVEVLQWSEDEPVITFSTGTFNNRTGSTKMADCIQCLAGYACDEEGLVYPYRQCAAGFFCKSVFDAPTIKCERITTYFEVVMLFNLDCNSFQLNCGS